MTAALTLAAEHDLAGRHDDAMTELGRRLIIGDKGPLLPKDNEKWLVSQFIRNRVVLGARAEVQAR